MKKIFPALIVCMLGVQMLMARHIVGGFLSYKYISGSTYEITLTAYRDCSAGNPPLDGLPYFNGSILNARVSVFDIAGNWLDSIVMGIPDTSYVGPPIDNSCLTDTFGVCVQQGVYKMTYTFPSTTDGYYISYVRCCRNPSVNNLLGPDDQGTVYTAYIPPSAAFHNSSPEFNRFPPTFICVNAPLKFDHSATDPDGDQLVYSLCSPYFGIDSSDPEPVMPPGPPYTPVNWQAGYSGTNPLGNNALVIDGATGFLTGTPTTIGQFVVGICVSEYRNGALIGTYLRDFQFNVVDCNIPIADIPSTDINPQTGIGIFVINCENKRVQFKNNSTNPPPTSIPLMNEWDFGVNGITTDTSSLATPAYDYPDTGTYLVRLIVTKSRGVQPCTDTTYAYVKIYPGGNAGFTSTPACPYSPIQFTDQSTTSGGTITGWQWNFGDGNSSALQNPIHSFPSGNNFTVTLIAANSYGCKDTVQHSPQIYQPPSSDFIYTPPCIDSVVTFTLPNSNNVSSYLWTFDNGSTSTSASPSYAFTSAGTFPVSLITTSNDGCKDTTTKNLEVQLPVTASAVSPVNGCEGTPVQLDASGGLYYEWTPHAGLNNPFTSSPFALPASSTTYTVRVANDCYSDTAAVALIIHQPPVVDAGPDTLIWRDTYALLHGTTSATHYFWNPSTWLDDPLLLTTKAEPPASQWYELFAIDDYGCMSKDSVYITVEPFTVLAIPTAFSPDGNGVNDVFRIVHWLNVESLSEFSIYNRWGQKVFETKDIEQGWDGTFNNKKCELGVYVWLVIAKAHDGGDVVRRGNVTLVR